jgi:hypothetical protein
VIYVIQFGTEAKGTRRMNHVAREVT